MKKFIIISAPSGAGKTSIVRSVLKKVPQLAFSISATTRKKRENEINGKDYFFLTLEEFKKKISEGAFLEWEEVYKDCFYGTLKSEVQRISNKGKTVIFDLDVVGGLKLKKKFIKQSLSIFIMPPSTDILTSRLKSRGTETKETLKMRVHIAKKEMLSKDKFDKVILNEDFSLACKKAKELITNFINLKK